MADIGGRLTKMERDYTEEVDKELPRCKELAANGHVSEALEQLLSLEKRTRLSADGASTKRVLVAIVQLCFDTQDWEALNENVMIMTKRRGQLKMAIQAMVEQCIKFIDETPDKDTKLKLISTLRTATEGKIYVEVERARLTMELARMKEADGEVIEAAKVLQELQVETFGSMKREEKVEFILEQMRLGLAKQDFIRTQIISKKVSTKFFTDITSPEVQKLKLKFYQLMVDLGLNSDSFLDISRHYFAMYETPCVQEDRERKTETLCNVILYCLLAPFDNEQSDMLHRMQKEKLLEDLPLYKDLVKKFVTQELIVWSQFQLTFAPTLREASRVFTGKPAYWEELRKRVVEHNIRIIAKYYTKVRLQRLADLLDLPAEDTEEFLSNLVLKKTIFARIDRPDGVIIFRETKDASDVLNEWSGSLSSLMTLVSKATHLIHKEEMVHGAKN